MCIPHAPKQNFTAEKRQRHLTPKASTPFNKKLLEPDPDFKDERTHPYLAQDKHQSLLGKLFSFIH
ncbi:hypothetical protein JHD50_02365 [Sulfurimonas sp. MAG313]|nr:hypothetical protein [Sulfurimonas sp. MAG313]MDF1880156.1 hypothetical protein [Sulfurimonas sp. MAG313]